MMRRDSIQPDAEGQEMPEKEEEILKLVLIGFCTTVITELYTVKLHCV